MKTVRFFLFFFSLSFLVLSCDEEEAQNGGVQIPEQFTVDIPESLSSNQDGSLSGRLQGDGDGRIEGDEIYEALRFFIYVGEQSAEIIEFVLKIGATLEQLNVSTYTYTSEEDGRSKRIDINRDVIRGGVGYAYELVVVDVDDNAQALQLLWNVSPVEGIGILNPYNINRAENGNDLDARIRIDYNEDDPDYDATMIVSISGLLTVNDGDIDNMKIFAGKKGDIVEVRGNSNHPEIIILDDSFIGGRNYAFVGRGDDTNDIGVVKLALPPSSTTTSDVFMDYSVFGVLEGEIQSAGITDEDIIDQILMDANSPAYFNEAEGFIGSGTDNVPSGFSSEFVDLSNLSPFVPKDIKDLEVDFIN